MTIKEAVVKHLENVVENFNNEELGRWFRSNASRGDFEYISDLGDPNLHELLSMAMCKNYEDGTPHWLLNEAFRHYLDEFDGILEAEMDCRDYAKECKEMERDHSKPWLFI